MAKLTFKSQQKTQDFAKKKSPAKKSKRRRSDSHESTLTTQVR
uniref:Uncharacterized protein n=1 Tax=Arundo donax TaxID=35708 RepID=A0A0A9APB6_ARUDO